MECSTNLPQAAFFSAEEKVQLMSGNCPRHITKERLGRYILERRISMAGCENEGGVPWPISLCKLEAGSAYSTCLFT